MGFGYLGRSPIKIIEKESPQYGVYPIGSDCRPVGNVIVPEGPISLNYLIFKDDANIDTVQLPSSIVLLQPSAFENCINLKNVSFSDDLQDISERCFYGDTKLEMIICPPALISIQKEGYANCVGLQDFKTIENHNFTTIEDYAFFNCSNLLKVDIYSKNLSYIGESAFEDCVLLKSFLFNSKNILEIGPNAFKNTLLDSETVSKIAQNINIDKMHPSAFSNLLKLTYVITKATTDYYFDGCSNLKEAIIQNVNAKGGMGEYTFANCPNLQKCTLPINATAIDNNLFKDNTGLKNVNIPKQIQSIGNYAFYNCSSLNCEVELPETLTSLGSYAFSGCKQLKLKNGLIPSSVTIIKNHCFLNATGDDFNLFNTEILNIDNTKNNIYIKEQAFANSGFKTINFLGEQQVYLHTAAFQNSNVNNITFCSEKPILNFEVNKNSISLSSGSTNIFNNNKLSEEAVENILNHLSSLNPVSTWIPAGLFQASQQIKDITIPHAYSAYMFKNSTNLIKVSIKTINNVDNQIIKNIAYNSFEGCTKLKQVYIGSDVGFIYSYSFNNCTALTDFEIDENGSSLRFYDRGCFEKASSLKKLILPTRVSYLPDYFSSSTSFKEIFIMNPNIACYGSSCFSHSNNNISFTVYYTKNKPTGSSSYVSFKKVERVGENICWWFTDTFKLNLEGIGKTIDYTDTFQDKLDIINQNLETPKTIDDYIVSTVTVLPTDNFSDTTIYRIKNSDEKSYSDYILFENNLTEVRTVPTFDKNLVKEVVIREGRINSLGENLFKNCVNLILADIPATVTNIAASAFDNCNENLAIITTKGSFAYNYAVSKKLKIYAKESTETLTYDYLNIPSFVDGTKFIVDTANQRIVSGTVADNSFIASEFVIETPDPIAWASITGYVSCESNWYDAGGVYVSSEPRSITSDDIRYGYTYGDGKWIMRQTGTNNIMNTFTTELNPLTKYYLYFCYRKDSSGISGEDKIVIQNIKIGYYTKEELEYNYDEIEDKIPDEQVQG